MKKLITLVAAMIGFGAFAVEPVITGTGFETAAYTADSALAVTNDDAGVGVKALSGFAGLVWDASKELGEDAMVKAYDQDSGSYTPSATYLTRHDEIGANFLALDIGDARLDRYMTNCAYKVEENEKVHTEQPQEISATGFYIDTLVKFTAAEEPSWSAMQATDKLSITYIEHDADPTADPVDAGYTNFVVRAGFIDDDGTGNCTITPTEYKLSVPANFDKSAWHRLTVRAIKDIGYAQAPVAFVVYVDEVMLQYSSSTQISTDNVTFGPMGTRFYSDTVHALLPSLLNTESSTYNNISKLGFSGTGSIDNIAFVQNVIPEFVTEPTPVTLKWGEGFASITITPAGNDPIPVENLDAGEFNFELPVGVNSFTVAATYETGYEALPWTMNEVEIEGATFANVTPGSVCTLNAMKPVFNVIIGNTEQKFESLEDALAAIPDGDEGGTLKLMADYTGCVEVGDEKLIILDLAGKTITPGELDTAAIMNSGAYLIITNSTTEAGVVLGAGDDNYAMLLCDDSTTEVYGGKFAGEILLDGEKYLYDVLTVFGGTFYDAAATGAEDFYLAASLDSSVDGKVDGPDADGYFTVGVEPEVKPFQVIIADVATGYDTFELALAAANEAEAATIVLGEDVPTAGKLTITGNVTIDLAGFTIAQDQDIAGVNNSGVLIVAHGGTLTIDDSSKPSTGKIDGGTKAYAAVAMTGTGDTDDTETATLVVNAGTLQGHYYGVVGNGNPGRGNTSVTINGGLVQGTNAGDCHGIYNPQEGTVAVTGGIVQGDTGIYAKAGTITVTGGEIIANGESKAPAANGNGADPTGDAIVLDTKTGYAGQMSLTLGAGAKVTSANGYAVRETVTQGDKSGTLAITDNGATLTGELGGLAVSDDFTTAINEEKATIVGYTIVVDGVCGNDSLLAAIDKVTDGGTITLLADVPNATGITIDSKKTFTVDFNGFTYTVNKPGAGSTGTATQAFQLLKGQTITFKNGTINAAADNLVEAVLPMKNIKRFFQSYANLTLENMTLDGTNLYLNPADNAVCEFANGTVALTGSTSIDAPENCIAVSVDNWKKAYPNGVAVTINTTGMIDGVKVWTEGEGASTPAQLTLTAGTITALEVAGEDADFTVTKGEGATVTAPAGYEWDETTGALKKVEEPVYPDAETGAFSLFIADAETGDPAQYPNVAGVAFPVAANGFPVYDFAMSTLDDNHLYAIGFMKNATNAIGFLVAEYEIKRDSKGAIKGIKVPATDANRKWFVQLPDECLDPAESGWTYTYTKALAITAETADSVTFKLAMEADKGLGTLTVNRTTGEGAWTLGKTCTSMGIAYDAEADLLAYATTAGLVIGETTVAVDGIGAVRRPVLSVGDSTFLVGAGANDTDAHSIWKVTAAGAELILPASALKAAADNGATIRIEDMALATVDANTFLYLVDRKSGKVLAWQWDATAKNVVNPNQFEVIDVKAAVSAQFTGLTFSSQFQSIAFTSKGEMLVGLGSSNNQTSGVFAFSEVPNAEVTVELDNATLTVDGVAVTDVFEAEPGKAYTLVATADDGYENATIEGATPGEDGKYVFAEDATITVTATEVPGLELYIADKEYNADPTSTDFNPYVVASEADLLILAADVLKDAPKYADKYILQTANIALIAPFAGIGDAFKWNNTDLATKKAFKGVYDGGNFAITNVKLDNTAANANSGKYQGLFNSVFGGTVKNLKVGFVDASAEAGDHSVAVVGNLLSDNVGQAVVSNVTTLEGLVNVTHNSAGIVNMTRDCGDAAAPVIEYCTNNLSIANSDDKAAGIVVNPAGAGPIKLTGCVNNGTISVAATSGCMAGIAANNQVTGEGTELILKDCVNAGALVTPDNYTTGGAFVGQDADPVNCRVILESGNKMLASQIPFGAPNGKQKGFTYAIVDDATPAMATFVADSALAVGNTYTLYADATPAITLAADESITFDKNGFTLTATGIVAGEGAELEAPVEAGTRVTYSAKAASTAPEFTGGTVIMVAEEGGTITNGNSTMTITLETGWTVAKNEDDIWELKNGDTVFGKFPEYYDAAVSEAGVVSIALNAKALCEMDLGTEAEPEDPLTVTDSDVSLAIDVESIKDNLYYGLATKASLDAKEWTAPDEYILGSELKKQPVLEATKVDDAAAGFYVISVTDVIAE